MACEHPRTAYLPANGGQVRFQLPRDGRAYTEIKIPCGICILCKEEHARQWAVRITHESQLHDECSFITLTYSDEHTPPYNSLQYDDLEKFWDRINKQRKRAELKPLRYYAVGEYGDRTQRPHYHACVFGDAFLYDRQIIRQTPTLLWTCPLLVKAWGLGHVSVGQLNFETAMYTASYITKKLRAKQKYVRVDEKTGELLELAQPRAMMSRNIAIGWLEQYADSVYNTATEHVVIDGRPQKPPQAYDRWLRAKSESFYQEVKASRKAKAIVETPDQTRARARNAHARAKSKSKSV